MANPSLSPLLEAPLFEGPSQGALRTKKGPFRLHLGRKVTLGSAAELQYLFLRKPRIGKDGTVHGEAEVNGLIFPVKLTGLGHVGHNARYRGVVKVFDWVRPAQAK
ncbi:hypothetical protein ACFL2M_00965 [Patescibacteria group bacterium]